MWGGEGGGGEGGGGEGGGCFVTKMHNLQLFLFINLLQQCMQDIMDGFFPSELQGRYPNGISFEVNAPNLKTLQM